MSIVLLSATQSAINDPNFKFYTPCDVQYIMWVIATNEPLPRGEKCRVLFNIVKEIKTRLKGHGEWKEQVYYYKDVWDNYEGEFRLYSQLPRRYVDIETLNTETASTIDDVFIPPFQRCERRSGVFLEVPGHHNNSNITITCQASSTTVCLKVVVHHVVSYDPLHISKTCFEKWDWEKYAQME